MDGAWPLNGDILDWLLEPYDPPVRHLALRGLLERAEDSADVVEAREAIMSYGPIRAILSAQYPEGYWVKPGPGYSPKYRSTVWQLILLDQLGAVPADPRVRRACEYVLEHTQANNGGFGASGSSRIRHPPADRVYHCLNGNLIRALCGLGHCDDARLARAVAWQVDAVTGDGDVRFFRTGTSGPGFACGVNGGLPCAWGAIKALRGLARVVTAGEPKPSGSDRSATIGRAIQSGVELLLSRDPARADYPAGDGRVSPLWFRLGFPSCYAADVLQNLEVLTELGYGRDERLRPAIEWLLSEQDTRGRWRNQSACSGKLWADIERPGSPSKWVTLRALQVLKSVGLPLSDSTGT
jgi:hypothetical protein